MVSFVLIVLSYLVGLVSAIFYACIISSSWGFLIIPILNQLGFNNIPEPTIIQWFLIVLFLNLVKLMYFPTPGEKGNNIDSIPNAFRKMLAKTIGRMLTVLFLFGIYWLTTLIIL